jgi:hypothetical protein
MNKRLACALVSRDAVSVVTEALRDAKGAGAFHEVAEAMVVSIAAIVGRESGADAVDHLLAAAQVAADHH